MAWTVAPAKGEAADGVPRPSSDPGRERARSHARATAREAIVSVQSRETGDVVPESQQGAEEVPVSRTKQHVTFAKSWAHLVAGGLGGMAAAAVTAPLDVLKTRLQSDFYQAQLRQSRAALTAASASSTSSSLFVARAALNPFRAASFHLRETGQILASVYRQEGPRALFKGLGPNLIGVVPARSISFFTYGNCKPLIAHYFNRGQEAVWVHLTAGMLAGIATSTATNPIWLVKTRLQLDRNVVAASGGTRERMYRNSWDCVQQVVRQEGVGALYRGMSASYLGVAESTLQWMLYEQMKKRLARREERIRLSGRDKTVWDHAVDSTGNFWAAGGAKLIAAVLAYPHEVVRTRLRQAPLANGRPKYTGLIQCFKLVAKEEGLPGLYGGMTPHLLRTVPSAAIMFTIYEGTLRLLHG